MVDRDQNDVFKKLAELPIRRYVEVLRNKAQDLVSQLGMPAYFDQYPSKRVPWIFSRTYGPIPLTSTRKLPPPPESVGGFNQLAQVANPSAFLLPREGTIKTGREAAFVWCSSNAFAYVNWTYTQSPGAEFPVASVPIAAVGAGDILDPVLSMNGGAVIIPNIANANHTSPRVCFEMALYDKKRGRFLTDGSLPAEAFVGGAFSNKMTPKQTRFNVDTEIEPRLVITEVNMGPVLDDADAYAAASVAVYVNVAFIGYNVLEEKYNEADTFSAIKSGG